jgi:hypothetical protein
MSKKKSAFDHFIASFPAISLPITLGEDTHITFSRKNKPLSQAIIREFIEPLEDEVFDDTTEVVPCFRIADIQDFYAIVYWKAELLSYQYILVTISKDREVIDKKTIAGTFSDGKQLTQSVATINENRQIYVASGQSEADQEEYEAASSSVQRMAILDDGQIKIQD